MSRLLQSLGGRRRILLAVGAAATVAGTLFGFCCTLKLGYINMETGVVEGTLLYGGLF